MRLASFLSSLFAGGRVRVNADALLSAEDLEQSRAQLVAFEQMRREDLPGIPRALELEAALYGAETLYRACQFLVFRDVEPEAIRRELGCGWPGRLSPAAHYSVDLTLQYLPDVVRLARGASAADPLVTELVRLAGRWPLSAVGVNGAEEGDVGMIVADACLLGMYVDRIIARKDLHRLGNERVRDAARRSIGAFVELAPAVAAGLGVGESQ